MTWVIVKQVQTPFQDARGELPRRAELLRVLSACGYRFPFRLVRLVRSLARDLGQISAVDIAVGLAEVLPSGLYSPRGSSATP